jgi:hypothetical protein
MNKLILNYQNELFVLFTGLLVVLLTGYFSLAVATILFIILHAVILFRCRKFKVDLSWHALPCCILFLLSCTLFSNAYLRFDNDGAWVSDGWHIAVDLPLHTGIIENAVARGHFFTDNFLLADAPLQYHASVDFLSAIFRQIGLSLPLALYFSTTYFLIIIIICLSGYYILLANSKQTYLLSWLLVIFSGSIFSLSNLFEQNCTFTNFSNIFGCDISTANVFADAYGNYFTTGFFGSRAYLLGLPLLLYLLFNIIYDIQVSKRNILSFKCFIPLIIIPILGGYHATIMAVGMISTFIMLSDIKLSLKVLIFSFICFCYYLLVQEYIWFGRFTPFWNYQEATRKGFQHGPFRYLVIINPNLIILVSIFISKFFNNYKLSKHVLYILCSSLVMSGIAWTIRLQPNLWDNLKIFIYLGFLISPLVSSAIVNFYHTKKSQLVNFLVFALLCSQFFVGMYSWIFNLKSSNLLFSADSMNIVPYLKTQIPVDSISVVEPGMDNPVWALAGRKVLIGGRYTPGWDYQWQKTWGLDFNKQMTMNSMILNCNNIKGKNLLPEKIKFIFVKDSSPNNISSCVTSSKLILYSSNTHLLSLNANF